MPVDPPHTVWAFPPVGPGVGELVAVGADLLPGTLLAAYRRGLFPMGADLSGADHEIDPGVDPGIDPFIEEQVDRWIGRELDRGVEQRLGHQMAWWSPDPRGVLPLAGLRVSRSLRQSARHFEIRVDTAFDDVLAGCADPARPGGWIDPGIVAAYLELHRLGWAHSVEAWRDGQLAGGLYGVAIGGLFAGESMFSRVRDASKVALMGLVDLLADEHADERLIDTQWQTLHLATLGVVEVPRAEYLHRLRIALRLPLPAAFDR